MENPEASASHPLARRPELPDTGRSGRAGGARHTGAVGQTEELRGGQALARAHGSVDRCSRIFGRLCRDKAALLASLVLAATILAALLAPVLAPRNPLETDLTRVAMPPSREHLLGTDYNGRDILSRILYGARVSLLFATLAVAFGCAIGVPLGLLSGYFERADIFVQRVTDVLMSIPQLLLAVAIVSLLGRGVYTGAIAIGVGTIPTYTRLVRSTVLALKHQEFIEAARALGSTHGRILVRHILPNVVSPVVVYSTLAFGSAIKLAAILGFLGLGAQPPTPEWGAMISASRQFMFTAPHTVVIPGLALTIVVLAINIVGDAVRDLLDPRLRL